eukprot:159028-Rhodomonas_salina.1
MMAADKKQMGKSVFKFTSESESTDHWQSQLELPVSTAVIRSRLVASTGWLTGGLVPRVPLRVGTGLPGPYYVTTAARMASPAPEGLAIRDSDSAHRGYALLGRGVDLRVALRRV